MREAEALEKILRPEALQREKEGRKIDPDQISDQGRTLPKIAKTLNTSHDTLHKVKAIAKEKPELIKDIDSGKKSVNSAYQVKHFSRILEKRLWRAKEQQVRKPNSVFLNSGKQPIHTEREVSKAIQSYLTLFRAISVVPNS